MTKTIIAGLILVIVLLTILLGIAVRENHKLQKQVEGYSDQVMELERMLEDE